MNRTYARSLTALPVQVTVFALTAVLLFLAAFFYPVQASAAESQTLATTEPISAGGSDWITFEYGGGSEPIALWLDSANNNITFSVWTSAQLAAGDSDPIGRGSANDYTAGDLYWTGEFAEAGTYYIEVQNNSDAADTFSLYVESDGVTVQYVLENVAITNNVEAVAEDVATDGGSGEVAENTNVVATTTPTLEQWQAIAPGETVWFTVGYGGDAATIEVWAETGSSDVAFAIYTSDQFANDSDPVGRGSDSEFTTGDLYWTGNFALRDTLHIAVTNNGSAASSYNLHISQ